ncbi:LysR substrate-binding domain-containing protein [Serratia rubidaea]|uniref:LysR substrate-binding domain-containing protein n=1 Tax=Serratia rubidaea TaxID=61652 RepID=UPI0023B0425F|nr:LysR substrate-binding domain-containing protein [Serratia rubidaea]MDK1703152.1 LysR substrate-binding domain-containing protein [Serratia rubidaea]
MELRHLRYFTTLVEEMHFGHAAEKLHIVQPALSKQILALEAQIGTPLLIRNSRNIVLTEAGERFYHEALLTLRQADKAVELARRAGRGLIGVLRIGYVGNAALSGALSHCLRHYRQDYPDVEIALQQMPLRALCEGLRDNRLDVAFASNLPADNVENLGKQTLCAWPWIIGMSDDHPLAVCDTIQPEQLREEAFVLYGDKGSDSDQIAILQRLLGRPPRVACQAADTITTLTLAAAGYGLSLLPATLRNIAMPGITYRDLAHCTERLSMDVIYRENDENPVIQGFLQRLTAAGAW